MRVKNYTQVLHIVCKILHTEVRVKEKRAFTVVHQLSAVISGLVLNKILHDLSKSSRVLKICEPASHASQGASHASHASHSTNVKNFYLLHLHLHENKNKSIGAR